MLAVYCFIVKSADYNYLPIEFLSKQFGNNIPKFSIIENSDMYNPEYLFCIDKRINILDIVHDYGYKCISILETYVEEEKYNSNHIIEDRSYDIYDPYHLVKYERV